MKPKSTPAPRALRPKQIQQLYGITQSTLHFYCTKLEPPAARLPSIKLPGKRGTNSKGVRLIYVHELEAWLEGHRAK